MNKTELCPNPRKVLLSSDASGGSEARMEAGGKISHCGEENVRASRLQKGSFPLTHLFT